MEQLIEKIKDVAVNDFTNYYKLGGLLTELKTAVKSKEFKKLIKSEFLGYLLLKDANFAIRVYKNFDSQDTANRFPRHHLFTMLKGAFPQEVFDFIIENADKTNPAKLRAIFDLY